MKIDNDYRESTKGTLVRSDHKYDLYDFNILKKLTVSKTILKPMQYTNGHKHARIDEVYVFQHGHGSMTVGGVYYEVSSGSVVLIHSGLWHQVTNRSDSDPLIFISIFNPYKRK